MGFPVKGGNSPGSVGSEVGLARHSSPPWAAALVGLVGCCWSVSSAAVPVGASPPAACMVYLPSVPTRRRRRTAAGNASFCGLRVRTRPLLGGPRLFGRFFGDRSVRARHRSNQRRRSEKAWTDFSKEDVHGDFAHAESGCLLNIRECTTLEPATASFCP